MLRRQKFAVCVVTCFCVGTPFMVWQIDPVSLSGFILNLLAYLILVVSLASLNHLGMAWFNLICVTDMWAWCGVCVVLDNCRNTADDVSFLGIDIRVMIGLCSPPLYFVAANVAHTALVLAVCHLCPTTLCDCGLGKQLLALARSLLVVYIIGLLNVVQLTRCTDLKARLALTEGRGRAVSTITEALCTCTVHLGPNFEITKSSPKLALLLNHDQNLRGVQFIDFIVDDDERTRFWRALLHSSSNMMRMERSDAAEFGQDGALTHLHLRGSLGTSFNAIVAYTCFHDESGKTQYIVGLSGASKHFQNATGSSISRLHDIDRRTCAVDECPPKSKSEEHALDDNSCKSGSNPSNLRDAVIEFKAINPCRIQWVSPAIEDLLGIQLEGKPFGDYLVDDEAFRWWLEERVNLALNQPEDVFRDLFGTCLATRDSLGNITPVKKIVLEVFFPTPCEDDDDDDDLDPSEYVVCARIVSCNQVNKTLRHYRRKQRQRFSRSKFCVGTPAEASWSSMDEGSTSNASG